VLLVIGSGALLVLSMVLVFVPPASMLAQALLLVAALAVALASLSWWIRSRREPVPRTDEQPVVLYALGAVMGMLLTAIGGVVAVVGFLVSCAAAIGFVVTAGWWLAGRRSDRAPRAPDDTEADVATPPEPI